MKKKLFLLFSIALVAANAGAQVATPSVVTTENYDRHGLRQMGDRPAFDKAAHASTTANKGTGATTRTYNYVDFLGLSNPTLLDDNTVSPPDYFWCNYDMFGVYQGTSALERDTIPLTSYGFVLHPFWSGFNDINAWGSGVMAVTSADAYTVDSIYAYGIYGRNPAKTSIVDTLRFAFTYGNGSGSNIGLYYYTGMASRYGSDTVRAAIPAYNAATHTLGRETSSTGPAVIVKDIYLRQGDTTTSVFKAFGVSANMNVPAANLVGVSVTFKTGEVYTPYSDTAFRGSVNPTVPYKYGMWRPMFVNEDATAFPTYVPGNYNAGQFRTLPESLTQPGKYSPTWAWTTQNGTAPSDFQFPYMDFKLSCPTCKSVSVKNVSLVAVGNAFPNPANNTVSLPITMKQAATVNVTMSNIVGQAMATQNLGQLSAGQAKTATFSTTGIANGVYFLIVEANGVRSTSRFVVAH